MSDKVLYEVSEGVATVTINRPDKRNSLDPDTLSGLMEAFGRAKVDDGVRVIVLTGAGDRAFCAGADLGGSIAGGPSTPLKRWEDQGRFPELFQAMWGCGRPIVARVNGHCLAGGMGVLLACDLAIASEDATFGTPEVKVGLFPYMIMALVFRYVGRRRGMEMVLTGDRMPAPEAADAGLINRAVPAAELDAAVDELVGKLKDKSGAVLKLGKHAFHATEDMPVDAALDHLRGMLLVNTLTEDAAEGIMAFLSKRPPAWKHR
jgi:enoyl-CoA hydratase/carnithine racemase